MESCVVAYRKEISKDTFIEVDEGLAARLLKSAINDYLAYPPERDYHKWSALWLFDDSEQEEPEEDFTSIADVCRLLKINYERLQVVVKYMADQGKRRIVSGEFERLLNTCTNRE